MLQFGSETTETIVSSVFFLLVNYALKVNTGMEHVTIFTF